MTLHEAIIKVLRERNRPMMAAEIANEVNNRKLYQQRKGTPVPSSQISARVNKVNERDRKNKRQETFYKKDGQIGLVEWKRGSIREAETVDSHNSATEPVEAGSAPSINVTRPAQPPESVSDESYVIDLCDEALGQKALRQHRFGFLRGDSRGGRRGTKLPVDAYYPSLKLVIEYHERQHDEPVPFFDKRYTVSGVSRGEQRRIYDQRRRDELPKHGITLVVFSYDEFAHGGNKRLYRDPKEDREVIKKKLSNWLPR